MKFKLFLIITAMLASYPAAAFADNYDSTEGVSSDIFFTDDAFDNNEFDNMTEIYDFDDLFILEEEAQLNGEAVPWDGITIAEPPVAEDGAYEISNGAQLAWIAEQVNSQRDSLGKYSGMLGKTIRLVEDIDLNSMAWTPIGCAYDKPFAGSFDGNGHSVSGLCFDAADYTNCGLFGCVLGDISNLTVSTAEAGIETSRHVTPSGADPSKYGVGIIAGSVDYREKWDYDQKSHTGSIEGCLASGSLTVTNSYGENIYIGGIAGVNSGGLLIDNSCSAEIRTIEKTTQVPTERVFVGGITGYNIGEIYNTDSYIAPSSTASIFARSANPSVGAIAGGNAGSIHDVSYLGEKLGVGKYTGEFDNYANIGGIAGLNSGAIESCTSLKDMVIENSELNDNAVLNIGGIAGAVTDLFDAGGIINACSASGLISTVDDAKANIGLICGFITDETATITDCRADNYAISVKTSANTVNAGGITGCANGVIDSCETLAGRIEINSTAASASGGIAGVSYNTVSDCVSDNAIIAASDNAEAVIYTGGISGAAYGNINRSSFSGEIHNIAAQAYAGGIAGYAGYLSGSSVLTNPAATKTTISKCSFEKDAYIECAYISGGIIGSAGNVKTSVSASEGTLTAAEPKEDTEPVNEGSSVAAGGLVGTAATGLEIENCCVTADIKSESAAGAVYAITGTGNRISTSYLAPVFNECILTYPVSSSARIDEITTYGVYINKDIVNTAQESNGIILVSNDEAKLRSTFTAKADEKLNFDNIWIMSSISPELQFRRYSNALSTMTSNSENNIRFHVTLENPAEGQHVYVALYNKDNRFCGTVSAVCSEEDINETGTKAEFALEYYYQYWDNPYNYEHWDDPDSWIPSENVPKTARAFTWDEANGLKNLSSVATDSLDIYFE